jgi:hypothetical protein
MNTPWNVNTRACRCAVGVLRHSKSSIFLETDFSWFQSVPHTLTQAVLVLPEASPKSTVPVYRRCRNSRQMQACEPSLLKAIQKLVQAASIVFTAIAAALALLFTSSGRFMDSGKHAPNRVY